MAELTNLPKVKLSKNLLDILNKMDDLNDHIAFEMVYTFGSDQTYADEAPYYNGLKITDVDVSKNPIGAFKVKKSDGSQSEMNCQTFIIYFFHNFFTQMDIKNFTEIYKKLVSGAPLVDNKIPIKVGTFTYNPKDPRATFLSLVTKTYPHGHEEEVLPLLPKLEKDIVGNYYKIIGDNPTTMFTCHLDTADRKQAVTRLYSTQVDGMEHIVTDGNTVLGADDKAGTTVMLYMMDHGIPGLYYFFIGEERGGIGSRALANKYDEVDYLKNIKRCVSFDRRKTISVITSQAGGQCCSDDFALALCDEYKKGGLDLKPDPTGVFTDSASFIDDISECTNVSVGYLNEHTGREIQNMDYLINLCKASVLVEWDKLPTIRPIFDRAKYKEMVSNVKTNNKEFIDDIKDIDLDVTLTTDYGNIYLNFDLDGIDLESIVKSLKTLVKALRTHGKSTKCYFSETYLQVLLGKEGTSKLTTLNLESDKSEKLKKYSNFIKEERDYSREDDIEHIKSLLRQMLIKGGFKNTLITNKKEDIKIQVIPESYGMTDYYYKLDEIIDLYEIILKLNNDIMINYDCECDLWETKNLEPMFTFNFYSTLEDDEDKYNTYDDYDDDYDDDYSPFV